MKLMLAAISLVFLLPNFFNVHLESKPQYDGKEMFDPKLSYINSIEKLIAVSDSVAQKDGIQQNSVQYAVAVSTILRDRFYHGFSRYPLNENWMAAVSEYFLGYGLASIVNPDDILQYSYGGCSQQSIVLMEVMKRKGVSHRYIGFPHHFATELKFNGNWYFFDPNMEPVISDSDRLESRWNCCADSLKKFYNKNHYPDLDWKFGNNLNVTFGKEDAPLAPNATIFQTTTKYLSKTLWLFPLVIMFYPKKKKISNRERFFRDLK